MEIKHPKIFHVVGEKNSGKTTLMKFLTSSLKEKGIKVGAFKHSSHNHDLDKPGSDSDSFRKAGADPTIFSTPDGLSIITNKNKNVEKFIEYIFSDCEIVLVESFKSAPGKKIVISDKIEYINTVKNVVAVVSSQIEDNSLQVFKNFDDKILDFIINKG